MHFIDADSQTKSHSPHPHPALAGAERHTSQRDAVGTVANHGIMQLVLRQQSADCQVELDRIASQRVEQIAKLLAVTPGQVEHAACGVTGRPCRDCRNTAPLECIDTENCGTTYLCRPCAATWRCRMWRWGHTRHVREFHCAVERYPALARLHTDPDVAAAIWRELRRAIIRYVKNYVPRLLAADLPEAIALLSRGGARQ
jgi:hypothetical protein